MNNIYTISTGLETCRTLVKRFLIPIANLSSWSKNQINNMRVTKQHYTQLVIGLLLMAITYNANAQDPRFSQFYASPMQLNPAMTGVFEGRWRAVLNYRDQWQSVLDNVPYRTFSASYDMRYNIVARDYLAFGISALGDQVGESSFRQTRGHLAMSYLKQLSGGTQNSQFLVAGAQAGVGQNSIDYTNLWFSQQFDINTETLDISQPTGESTPEATDMFVDINAGLLWYALFDDDFSVYAGGALNHINAPNVSLFNGQNDVLLMRWVGHAGAQLPLSDNFSLLPAFSLMGQGESNSLTMGMNVRYSNNDFNEIAVRLGGWVHLSNNGESNSHMDALIISTILELDKFNLGFSYDINTSSLVNATNSRGTYELSFIYIHPENRRIRVKCPKM